MTTSRVPAAVDALLQLCRAAPGLAEVEIVDGPPTVNVTSLDRLHIGYQANAEQAVELTQEFAYAGARRRDEAFIIRCYAEARGGDVVLKTRRDRVFAIVAEVETALRATDAAATAPTLGGVVQWAHLTAGDLDQQQGSDGSLAGLAFTVTCRARI